MQNIFTFSGSGMLKQTILNNFGRKRRKKRIEKHCELCGKVMVLPPWIAKDKKFCSKKCRYEAFSGSNHPNWKPKKRIRCETCGKEMELAPWESNRNKRFCSRECAYKYRNIVGIIKPDYSNKNIISYILGVLLGDGWVTGMKQGKYGYSYGVYLDSCELAFSQSFFLALKEIGLHPHKLFLKLKNPKHRDKWRAYAYSNNFCLWYKSLTLNDIWNFLEGEEEHKAFIRGFFESEGSNDRNGIKFSNTNFEVIKLVRDSLELLNFKTSLRKGKKRREKWKEEYTLRIFGGVEEQNRFLDEITPVIKNDKSNIKKKKICNFKKEEIEKLYFNPKLSIMEIAKFLNCASITLYRYINKLNIQKRGHRFYMWSGRKRKPEKEVNLLPQVSKVEYNEERVAKRAMEFI